MRYTIWYAGTTCGWTEKASNLKDYKSLITGARRGERYGLDIFDRTRNGFVFMKKALDTKPSLDMID